MFKSNVDIHQGLNRYFQNFPDATLVLDENQMVCWVNRRFESLLEWEGYELEGQTLMFIEEEYRHLIIRKIKEGSFSGNEDQEGLIIPCSKQSGEDIYLNIRLFEVGDKKVKTYTALLFSRLSESSLTLAALKESEERYKELFESSSDAIIIVDYDTLIIENTNEATLSMFEYEKSELLGQSAGMLIKNFPEKSIKEHHQILENEVIKDGLASRTFKTKNGDEFTGEISRSFFFSEGQKKIISSIRDISARLKLEEQLRQSQKMEAIGTLAGGIAHDFNNILSSVLGFTELALDEVKPGTLLSDNLEEVMTAGNRAKQLVQQILTFSRKDDPEFKMVKVKSIIEEASKLIRASLPSTIDIIQELNSESNIYADPTQIHQIIMNLCANAGQAMEEYGGVLKISLSDRFIDAGEMDTHKYIQSGYYTEIVVQDSGDGIQKKYIKQVFDPFFTTKPKGKGTGMGLAVIQGIVQTLKGFISVDSERGKGTIFKVYLPVMGNLTEEFKSDLNYESTCGTERILFVDDEEALVLLWLQVLGNMGYDIKACNSSVEALKLFKERPDDFDIIITDYTMPNMNGEVFSKEILKIRPDIPIILCTGYSHKFDDNKASRIGISAYINKPILKVEITSLIRHLLDKKK